MNLIIELDWEAGKGSSLEIKLLGNCLFAAKAVKRGAMPNIF